MGTKMVVCIFGLKHRDDFLSSLGVPWDKQNPGIYFLIP